MKRKYVFAPYLGCGEALYNVRVRDIERVTHLNIAFMHVVDGEASIAHLKKEDLDTIRGFKKINPDLKLVFSIGGWGAGGFSDACKTPEGLEKLASSTVKIALDEGFDGVDIDWEYPCSDQAGIDYGPYDKENFTAFMRSLRKHLDAAGEGHILSVAVGAEQYYIDGTEMDKVAEVCDFINLMTYDMRGGFTNVAGHHTNLYYQQGDKNSGPASERTVEIFHEAGVPYEKMVLGAAFYGRVWSGCNTWVNNGLGATAKTVGTGLWGGYDEIKRDYINKNGYVRFWDDAAKAPYLYNGDTFISYDDPDSLREKCKYIQEKGLAGMMYWVYGCHELFEAIENNLP